MEILKLVRIAIVTIFNLMKELKFFLYVAPIIIIAVYLFLKYFLHIF